MLLKWAIGKRGIDAFMSHAKKIKLAVTKKSASTPASGNGDCGLTTL
jgi:hypothetical protein